MSKRFNVLCLIIISFLVFRPMVFNGSNIIQYETLINPLFWMATAIVAYLFAKDEANPKQRSKIDIIQTVIIVLILYLIVYFSLGLFFGYTKSPYSHEFFTMMQNLWKAIPAVILQEYVRFQLIKVAPKKKFAYVIITALFIVTDITFWNFTLNFRSNVDFFKYISEIIIPLVVTNVLFTYFALTSGFITSAIYRVFMLLVTLLLPIYPDLNWLLKTMMDLVLVIIVALYTNYVQLKANRLYSKREIKKERITSYIPFMILLIITVCFIGGMFRYQPIAILSNSMYPNFARGDAVIIEKINNNSLKNLKKGDIIYYSKEGTVIAHRIVEVSGDSIETYKYKTKGDNNNAEDSWTVTPKEVIGVVKFMVPYIGYPSVLVNELLR